MLDENYNGKSTEFTQGREISWLKFNERILEEADDVYVPVLERLKYVSIYASNLDEFFMIRVGTLHDKLVYSPLSVDNKSGQNPGEQLNSIYEKVDILNKKFNGSFKRVETNLRNKSISLLDFEELEISEVKFVKQYFKETIYPLLSPQIVDPHHPFPHFINKSIYIECLLKHKNKTIFGVVPVPDSIPPIIFLPGEAVRYILIEKIILEFLDKIFDTYHVDEKTCIAITRNEDTDYNDDVYSDDIDFRNQMKKLLHLKKRRPIVRLETSSKLSSNFEKYLCDKLMISSQQIFVSHAPLRMNYVYHLLNFLPENSLKELLFKPFDPVNELTLSNKNMMQLAGKNDILLHYPYMSFKPFLHLVMQAATSQDVLSIKITIYRLGMKAAIVDYLCIAAENGKDVTVIIELRARFDEQNNIDWSEKLEDAGCKLIYGFEEFKVHSKICLITYKDKGRIKYITQIGTGNYNEKTAELYTDLSLITGSEEIGLDVSEYFRNMSIGNLEGQYKHILVAPFGLKPRLLDLIDEEIKKGMDGRMFFKLNSLTDIDIINKLTEASSAGVSITMVVRGICCILPGVPGMTENIKVKSIVGRYLEHSRIYSFGVGASQKLFISSADFMTRNLDRRVEIACPIYDTEIKKEINEMIELMQYDNVKARMIDRDGNFNKLSNNRIAINSQDQFMIQAMQRKYWKRYKDTSKLKLFKEYIDEKLKYLLARK